MPIRFHGWRRSIGFRFFASCVAAYLFLMPCNAPGQTTHVLSNQALELTVDVKPGPAGGIRLTGIRDLNNLNPPNQNSQWLSSPSPLFELSANGKVWSSDTGLVVDSVQQVGAAQLTVQAHTRGSELMLQLQIAMVKGTGPAVVTGSITNPASDWIGPFIAGDKADVAIPVFPASASVAAVRPTRNHEEALMTGFDGIVYSSEENNDGAWGVPRPLQSTTDPRFRNFFPPGAAIAAVRRNDHQSDIFAIASDGSLNTMFRVDNNWWSAPVRLSHANGGNFLAGASVAALSVHEQTDPPPGQARTNEVDVFAVSRSTGQVMISREINDGPFSEPVPLNPSQAPVGASAHLAAVKRNESQQDLFAVNGSGQLLTTFHNAGPGVPWSNWIPLSTPGSRLRPGSPLAAVRGPGNDVYVFVLGQSSDQDSTTGCIYETHETNDGPWSTLSQITPPNAQIVAGSPITAVRRTGSEIDVMMPLQDGRIGLVTRRIDGSWSPLNFLPNANPVNLQTQPTAILRRAEQLDVFAINAATGKLWTSADGSGTVTLRTVFPKIVFPGSGLMGAFGMVPQEAGGLASLKAPGAQYSRLGMPYQSDSTAQAIGLPEGMNALEVANVARNCQGCGSLFFEDWGGSVELGRAPAQFVLGPDELDGFWVSPLKGRQQIQLPQIAIGVAGPDFRRSIDSYVGRHAPEWKTVDTPAWLSEAAAIYTFAGGGAGGIYLGSKPGPTALSDYSDNATGDNRQLCSAAEVHTFLCVAKRLVSEATALGTNVVYLYDYWGAVGPPASPITTCPDVLNGSQAPYFCKGDYFIRSDLNPRSDPHANPELLLKEAIDFIHGSKDNDGRPFRVILYLEPFVVHNQSGVGNAFGDLWGSRFTGAGDVWRPFTPGDTWSIAMSDANGEWQQKLVETAKALIAGTGADGIFLDSGGWRLNIASQTKQEVVMNSSLENAMAVLNLVDRVRAGIRSLPGHADAVVLSETTSGPMWRHVDGGVSADLLPATAGFTGEQTLNGSLLTSPIRYGAPQIRVFTNGQNLNELNQVFAVGHNLALTGNWAAPVDPGFIHSNSAYIANLVEARRQLSSALIHGPQVSQLDVHGTNGNLLEVYSYAGTPNVVILLNPQPISLEATIPVHSLLQPGTHWQDWISGSAFTMTSAGLTITVPPVSTGPCGRNSVCGLMILEQTGR